ncbi:Biotin--acetyl-CoA-carboxylase ligase [Candidatus Glomeribacter gigasporarum BEG34]|uniref:Biotin--acetyl-CoA-carboxylase ligase n=1 Tax=Candidatus Glomeribacter gigasporarum BEG34 TaxID=1070319 RepID=G2J954_9BURK|nr:biotin--[acetyl-CoA-carboxylase] ligase [Candidatus Glomeribacter gigasporarum]CCD29301.1 Biotin--acetyl-CoA-carboxylase ligase [Candidatus Glomeribacter gigasporarum BEG34]
MYGSAGRSIDPDRLAAQLTALPHPFKIEIVPETGSTNTDLMTRLRASKMLEQPIARIAYRQTAGRGQRGRRWLAQSGDALLFSVAFSIPRPVNTLAGLSLAASVAVLNGLRALPLTEPRRLALKWPNDLLLDGAKLGGILVETIQVTHKASIVVIGAGINMDGEHALAAQLDARARPPAALKRILADIDFTQALAHVLHALADMLEIFSAHGFAPFQRAWRADCESCPLPCSIPPVF